MKVEIRRINFVITVKVTISKLRTDKCLLNRTSTSIGGKYSIKYFSNTKTQIRHEIQQVENIISKVSKIQQHRKGMQFYRWKTNYFSNICIFFLLLFWAISCRHVDGGMVVIRASVRGQLTSTRQQTYSNQFREFPTLTVY